MVHTTRILILDFATQRLPPDSNLEKTFVRRYYGAARRDKENSSRWLKAPKDGGLKPYERRANYMSWISRARREFLENHQGDIWKTTGRNLPLPWFQRNCKFFDFVIFVFRVFFIWELFAFGKAFVFPPSQRENLWHIKIVFSLTQIQNISIFIIASSVP